MGAAITLVAAALLAQAPDSVSAVALPSAHVTSPHAKGGNWHFQVGEHVYRSPEEDASLAELSANVKDYYYAFASSSALTPELLERRVGGEGRLHIFHLPDKASWPQKNLANLDRRSAVSAFIQLEHGANVPPAFPEYDLEENYKNPLSDAGQSIEKNAVAEVTAEIYTKYLKLITTEYTRSWNNKTATDDEVSLLSNQFKSLGFETCTQKASRQGAELTNIIAYVKGASPNFAVVGAHYDSRPFDGPAPGAVDNGSGVAGLLAMARAFKAARVQPERSVYFVAFAGEEPGLWGSDAFVSDLSKGGDEIPAECKPVNGINEETQVSAIVMDEIGWVSDKLDKATVNLESFPWTAEMMNHLAGSCKDHNRDLLRVIHNSHPFGSDHMSFLDRQMQSVLTIQGDDEAYPHYHKSSDTIDHVTPEYASQIVKMNTGALLRIAGVQIEEKPTEVRVLSANLRGVKLGRHDFSS